MGTPSGEGLNLTLSPSELLKAEDVRTHISAVFLRICAIFLLLNAKQEKQALFMILAHFDKTLQNFTCFNGILGPFLCEKWSVRKLGCTIEFAFRRSDLPCLVLILGYSISLLSPTYASQSAVLRGRESRVESTRLEKKYVPLWAIWFSFVEWN